MRQQHIAGQELFLWIFVFHLFSLYMAAQRSTCRHYIFVLFMVALCNRADHYIFAL